MDKIAEAGKTIDIEATVVRLETPEMDAARALVEKVRVERQRWADAWTGQMLRGQEAVLEEFAADAVGCAPGSCQMKCGERVLAKFIVRFREDLTDVEFDAEWPRGSGDFTAETRRTQRGAETGK